MQTLGEVRLPYNRMCDLAAYVGLWHMQGWEWLVAVYEFGWRGLTIVNDARGGNIWTFGMDDWSADWTPTRASHR